MDEVIWVEVLSRHRHVVARHRCEGPVVRIGRAYSNDVVLDDPYVAPEHVRIFNDGSGALVAEDLGSANGLYADHGRAPVRRLALGEDTVFRVGNTLLRVRMTAHPVAAERVFAAQRLWWPALAGAAAAVLLIAAAVMWLADYTELRAANYVVPLLGVAVLVAVWSALWSMASRIFAGQARFETNLFVGLIGALGFEAWYVLSDLGAFGFSWSALVTYRYVGYWCVLALVAFGHLHQLHPARSRLAFAVVGALLAVAVAVQILVQLDPRSGLQQSYVRRLLPPAFRLMPVEDEAGFFAKVGQLQGRLDQDRAAEP